jgi:hypothetical protein
LKIIVSAGRRAPLVCALLLTSCLIAACGGSSSSSTSSTAAASTGGGSSGSARRAALRSCLKAHGVTLPSRPPGGGAPGAGGGAPGAGGPPPGSGGGSGFFGGGGGFQNDPKARAAFQACGGGNLGAGRRPQLSHQAITSYVTCVRQHGYNMPNPNFSGKGAVFPSSIRSDPKFQAANRTCQSLLVPGRGGTSTGSSST